MTTRLSSDSAELSGNDRADYGEACLVLDRQGRVLLGNEAARAWWSLEQAGRTFATLFSFEVVSTDPDLEQAQWEALLDTAADVWLDLTVRTCAGEKFEAQVRLEPVIGTAPAEAAYWAYVRKKKESRAYDKPAMPRADAGAEETWECLTGQGPVGFFELDFRQDRAFFSPAWKRLLGYSDHQLEDSHEAWQRLIHPEDSAVFPRERTARGSPDPVPFSIEYRMRRRHSDYSWFHATGIQFFGADGTLERVAGVQLDIQERKELEELAVISEDRLEFLTGRAGLAAFDFDFAAGSYWISPAWKELLGYKDSELPNRPETFLSAVAADEESAGLQAYFARFASKSGLVSRTGHLRDREGGTLAVEEVILAFVSKRGELTRAIGFHRKSSAATALGEGGTPPAAILARALDELAEGLLLTDGQGTVVYLNKKAARLLGTPRDRALGRPAADVFHLVQRESGAPVDNPVETALQTGEAVPANQEFALESADGKRDPIHFFCLPVEADSRRISGTVLVFRNPEEMTLSPEELIKSNRFEALGVLAGGIAHDFNNILTTILGGISIAKDNKDPSALEDSEHGCLAAKNMTRQLLNFAKGGGSSAQVTDLGNVIRESARLAAAGSVAAVELDLAPDLAPVMVNASQVGQVFQNLVINALQAMPRKGGSVWVRAANEILADNQVPPLPAGKYVQVDVRDNGCGIAPENLQKIFDPFFTTKKTGTGLGLATVLSIVRKHGGQVGVTSEVGTGTTFTVLLPESGRPFEAEARQAPTLRFGTGRILFMDDDPKICYLTGSMLESLEYKYDIANNGEEAIALYQRYLNIGRPYDAVIMDLTVIGGMGGEETFEKLREMDPEVRAVVSSGYDNDEMIREFLARGFCGYLTKPYRVTELGRILKTVLGK